MPPLLDLGRTEEPLPSFRAEFKLLAGRSFFVVTQVVFSILVMIPREKCKMENDFLVLCKHLALCFSFIMNVFHI